jgi:hypothetical protein
MKHKNVNPRQGRKTIQIDYIDPPTYWAEGDYWIGDDGKHYRVAGFRCINKETEKEIGGKW